MITIDKEILSNILKRYGIYDTIGDFSIIINGQEFEEEKPGIKIIARVILGNKESLIIKIVNYVYSKIIKEEDSTEIIINQQSRLSETLLSSEIRASKRYKSDSGECCYADNIGGIDCCITVEEFLGEDELKIINEHYVKELAGIMAKMHIASQASDCHIDLGTIWDIFNPDSDILQGYREYLTFIEKYSFKGIDVKRYDAVKDIYNIKKDRLYQVWNRLPRYAVQGDFSTNNVILNNDKSIKGIIDFNIAGDEVLVNDMITQGIFICYIMDLEDGLAEENRKELFDIFIQEYMKVRKLNNLELSLMNEIYSIVFPFLWTRTDRFEKYLKNEDAENANRFLEETWSILTKPYFI